MTKDGSAPRLQRGFVLLEALLALILLSTTLVLFAVSLQLGQRVVEAGRKRDQIAALTAGIDAISGLLGRTIPVIDRSDAPAPIVMFEGNPNRVAFVTLSQGETHAGGLLAAAIRIAPQRAKGGGVIEIGTSLLRVGDRPSLIGVVGGIEGGREILIGNISAAEFSYFGAKTGQPALWHSAWSGESLLPQLVSLRARVRLRERYETVEFTFRLNG